MFAPLYPRRYVGELFVIKQGLPESNRVIAKYVIYQLPDRQFLAVFPYKGEMMSICIRCGLPIEKARLRAMPDTNICAKCMGLDPDPIAIAIEENETAETIKEELRSRLNAVKREERDLNIKEESINKQIAHERQQMIKSVREELRLEEEELVGKKQQFEQEKSELLYTVDALTKELNSCVLNNALVRLQENQIIMHINPNRYTQKSPLLVGKAFVGKNIYNLAIWANINDKGRRYWSGYLNDTNGNMDGKSSNRRIWFTKDSESSALSGQISFGFVSYNVELSAYEHPITRLKYWKGKIWPITREQIRAGF